MKKDGVKKGVSRIGSGIPVIHDHAAGIDIGDTLQCVAITDVNGGHIIKTTQAFTCDLHEIVTFLQEHKITTVAMESTGVYWLNLYLLLEEAGIEVYLVNAKAVKNVSGRKKDDTDAVWIQRLHACGLLLKSFQPEGDIRTLRTYTRQRASLVSQGADAVRRMQKALELMNVKVHTVLSDILGKSGMSMVKAILAGKRDPQELADLSDPRVKAPREIIVKSLEGLWSEENLFLLEQALENYEFLQKQLRACEEKIKKQLEKQLATVQEGDISCLEEADAPTPAKGRKKKPKKNQFDVELSPTLEAIAGVDLCKIPGISDVTALEFLAEVGVDMNKWPDERHFAAWLNLTPNTKISGGKVISCKMMKKKNKAGQILKQAASCLHSNKTGLGDYYRKMRVKLGGKGAVVATAHKIAHIIYSMMKNKTEYDASRIIKNQEKDKEAKIRRLEKQIERLKKAS
jgi:transposase